MDEAGVVTMAGEAFAVAKKAYGDAFSRDEPVRDHVRLFALARARQRHLCRAPAILARYPEGKCGRTSRPAQPFGSFTF